MFTLKEAIALAEQAVQQGEATRYDVTAKQLDVETDQGWQTWWPADVEPNLYEGL